MALNFDFLLTNSKGLRKIILFKGLDFPIVITPSLIGEPLLTVQPFYFIENLDAVARIRFETQQDIDNVTSGNDFDDVVEYTLDNYLFEYSKIHPNSKLTSKISKFVFWKDGIDDPYHRYDKTFSECLALDILNDDTIIECKDYETGVEFNDWCLIKNYSDSVFDKYLEEMKNILSKKVYVKTVNNEALGTGEFLLPIIKTNSPLLTYYQASMFEVVNIRDFKEDNDFYEISRGFSSSGNFKVEQEVVEATAYHDRELLAYYFSALRDLAPLSQFRNFYNVIEYFFEEAPRIMSMPSRYESQMIEAVIKWAIPLEELSSKISSLPLKILESITTDQQTTSGEIIEGLGLGSEDLQKEFSSRIYKIRNACMHSKKTRRGDPTPRIVPSMKEENILKNEIPLLQWVAVKVIEQGQNI